MPLSALLVRALRPCEARLAQALASPIRGAPSLPEPWQAPQTASTTSLPCRSLRWASAPALNVQSMANKTSAGSNAQAGADPACVRMSDSSLSGSTRLLIRRWAELICVKPAASGGLLAEPQGTVSARVQATAALLLARKQHDHLAVRIALPALLLEQPVGDELAHRLPAGVDRQLPDRRVVGAACQLGRHRSLQGLQVLLLVEASPAVLRVLLHPGRVDCRGQ